MSSAPNLQLSAALARFCHASCGMRSLGYGVSTCSRMARIFSVASTLYHSAAACAGSTTRPGC
eukprot:6269433-Alexandrium_andersonii.AAC.1